MLLLTSNDGIQYLAVSFQAVLFNPLSHSNTHSFTYFLFHFFLIANLCPSLVYRAVFHTKYVVFFFSSFAVPSSDTVPLLPSSFCF